MLQLMGFLAGTLTTLAFVPQVVRTWRRRSGEDLSLGMLLAFSTGVLLCLLYGLGTRALPIILANAVTLALSVSLIVIRFCYRRRRADPPGEDGDR
ncbi:MAG: SemiSWEET family sugar transporter [Acidobacteriota bacterium]|nr:SemiSWEET family sugar transporter [Acidobacteriota bacterium]